MVEQGRRLYILVRRDLTAAQQIVQACHALTNLLLCYATDAGLRSWGENDHTIIILGVKDETELHYWETRLRRREIICQSFREPDLGDQQTALAVHPQTSGRLLRSLKLL